MRALFLTTNTNEVQNHILAWQSVFGLAEHASFNHGGLRNDWWLVEVATESQPDIIFYIGACRGSGNPRYDTLRSIRKIAPFVNLCSDAADHPWHPVLDTYRCQECFDLQVALDGDGDAPVDLAVLTPVVSGPFEEYGPNRDIHCGFSGSVGKRGIRAEIIQALEKHDCLTVRRRLKTDGYDDHIWFLQRCRLLLNTSWTGTEKTHHVKGRVLEAGWAGCALLEPYFSPTCEWFPENCYFSYKSTGHALEIIRTVPQSAIEGRAANLAKYCRKHYHPRQIYGQILERLSLVRPSFQIPAGQSSPSPEGLGDDGRQLAGCASAG